MQGASANNLLITAINLTDLLHATFTGPLSTSLPGRTRQKENVILDK
jgi:hypothetical protein